MFAAGSLSGRRKDFHNFGQRPPGSIPQSVAPAKKQVRSVQMEDLVDQLIGSNSQETTRLAVESDLRFLQDASERPMFLENGGLGGFRKKIETDFDRAKFHRPAALLDQQRHFPKIIAAFAITANNLKADPAAVKIFQCRSHVVL